jgi:hypothetical protein
MSDWQIILIVIVSVLGVAGFIWEIPHTMKREHNRWLEALREGRHRASKEPKQ